MEQSAVVEMRFFGGLSVEETAEVLKVSPVTVMRDWSTAKAWLYRELTGEREMDPTLEQVDKLLQSALDRSPGERDGVSPDAARVTRHWSAKSVPC